jgi:hypothetical protein
MDYFLGGYTVSTGTITAKDGFETILKEAVKAYFILLSQSLI